MVHTARVTVGSLVLLSHLLAELGGKDLGGDGDEMRWRGWGSHRGGRKEGTACSWLCLPGAALAKVAVRGTF